MSPARRIAAWPRGEGAMARLIRAHDWAATPLGPIEGWPQSLRTVADLVLGSGHAMQLAWGPERTILYNDAYAPILADRHPGALGLPFREASPGIWEATAPIVARVLAGETVRCEELPLVTTRRGAPEETWWNLSCTPLRDETEEVAGLLVVMVDATAKVRGERAEAILRASEERQGFLLRLSDALRPLSDPRAVMDTACRLLGEALDADRVNYAEVEGEDYVVAQEHRREGLASMAGRYRIDRFRPAERRAFEAGRTVALADIRADPDIPPDQAAAYAALDVRAFVSVPLVKEGRLVVVLSVIRSRPGDWTPAEVGLIEETAQRTWAAVERARVEAALREREARYRTLFETMDEGFVVNELIRDEQGRAIDLRYLELNPAVERLVGWKAKETVGRRMSEMISPEETRAWVADLEAVLASGASRESERYHASLGMWFRANAAPVGPDRVALVYQNTTAQKRAELALRASEERQAFLLRFSDALRAEPDADAIVNRAIAMLREHMDLDRCYVAAFRMDEDRADITHQVGGDRVPPMPPAIRLSDFPAALRINVEGTLVIEDVAATPGLSGTDRRSIAALGFGALVAATLRRGESNPLWTIVAVSAAPRRWTPTEIALAEDVAERTWAAAERARGEAALRRSEARFRALVTAGSQPIFRMSGDWSELIELRGQGVLADATGPLAAWAERYLLPEDRAAVLAQVAGAVRTRSLFELEHRVRRADGSVGWVLSRAAPILGPDGAIEEWFGAGSDVTARREAQERLRESEERFRQFGDAAADMLWIRDRDSLAFEYVSPAFEEIFGTSVEGVLGDRLRRWLDLILPEDREKALAAVARVREGEHVLHGYRIRRPDGQPRWIRDTVFPLLDGGGRVQRIAGIAHDATEEVALQERLQVLVAELQHRSRNLVGVVQGVTERTLATSATIEEFRDRIRARLAALGRVNALLSRLDQGDRIAFDQLLRTELQAHGVEEGTAQGTAVVLEGPAGIRLRSATVQTFALALHELTTNALKHGALSRPGGRLAVTWGLAPRRGDERRLRVVWQETGVPVEAPDGAPPPPGACPRRQGYGRELIERALPYQLKAQTSYELTPEGVRCTLLVPVSTTLDVAFSSQEAPDA